MNNIYENILSSTYIEDRLMYVITLVLNDEINTKLNTTNDFNSFLDGTSCGYFLQQLNLKMDVWNYPEILENLLKYKTPNIINLNFQTYNDNNFKKK